MQVSNWCSFNTVSADGKLYYYYEFKDEKDKVLSSHLVHGEIVIRKQWD